MFILLNFSLAENETRSENFSFKTKEKSVHVLDISMRLSRK
jgi:hypothetical protein